MTLLVDGELYIVDDLGDETACILETDCNIISGSCSSEEVDIVGSICLGQAETVVIGL